MNRRRLWLAAAMVAAADWPRATLARPLLPLAAPTTLRFVFSRPRDNPRTQWLIRVYTHLVEELGMQFEFVEVPPKRATAMVLSGEVAGELGRTFNYLDLHPALVRVAEPNNAVRFAAYALRPEPRFEGWDKVRARRWRCDCRLGIGELETMLARELAPDRVSYVQSIEQGLQKLRFDRSDLYFEVEEAVGDYLFFLSEAQRVRSGLGRLHAAGLVLGTTGHAYLHASRAALAPQLAAGLARLKRAGVAQRYLQESLQAYKDSLAW